MTELITDTVQNDSAPAAGRAWKRFLRDPISLAAVLYVLLLIVCAVFATELAPYGENEQNLRDALMGVSGDHWLGTDSLGRDTLSRLIYGSAVTLQAAFQAVILAAVVGIPLGLLVGYRGGWLDRIVMRVVDVGDSVPGMLLAFAVIAVLGRGLTNAMIAVGLIFVTNYVRLTRALVLEQRDKLYVDAARVMGLRVPNILGRQLLPNIATPLIVQTAIFAGRAVLIEASLSFLGLGLDVSEASWGSMLNNATSNAAVQPLLPWPPGVAIALTVLAFNLIGDGLRDALGDEKSLKRHRVHRRVLWPRTPQPKVSVPAAAGPMPTAPDVVLSVRDLEVCFPDDAGKSLTIVDGVSFDLLRGETLGLVGESGSGKTMTSLALMGLVPNPGAITGGSVRLAGKELTARSDDEMGAIRGNEIAMIFQDPLVALSPTHTIGRQLMQSLRNHRDLTKAQCKARAIELLELVGVSGAAERLGDYPHQFSGGMAQRVVIAMALACEPKVLVADEPTTALDVTVQEQVLDLIADLKDMFGMAVLLITHDLGVVADSCDRAIVMYAGQVVEEACVEQLFSAPRHPYTRALLETMPVNAEPGRLPTIDGRVPPPWNWPRGCRFQPRCPYAGQRCMTDSVPLEDHVRCVRQHDLQLPAVKATVAR